ncbi:MAG TPA: AAA family ATPase [Desulfobacteraceae bacterium]|mgnify:CR=1 FL=1|nr:AAA family ATPase [Desulfobacteraceae bacterium]HPQ28624.1 AAA family ATPase [Desulfobacteraceae bacterium]
MLGEQLNKAKGLSLDELMKQFDVEVDFIFREHLARGYPHILNGREGIGKTSIALTIAKEIINKHPGNVIWAATEGRLLDTLNKMKSFELTENFYVAQKANQDFKFNFQNTSDINEFGVILRDLEPISCVFIDSIRGMSQFGDNDDKIGAVMHKINALVCDRHHAALVYLDHHKKGRADSLLDKAVGTTAKTAAVSLVLSVVKKSAYVRELRVAKSNIGDIPELIAVKAGDRILIKEPSSEGSESMTNRAESFLLELFNGQMELSANEVYSLGERQGISVDVLKKVKTQLGIASRRDSDLNSWMWIAL